MLRFYKRRFDIPESKVIKITEEETKAQIAPYADYFTWEEVKRRMIGTITPVLATGEIYWIKELWIRKSKQI